MNIKIIHNYLMFKINAMNICHKVCQILAGELEEACTVKRLPIYHEKNVSHS